MKKRIHIYPHIILLIGRFFFPFLANLLAPLFLYVTLFHFEEIGILGIISSLVTVPMTIYIDLYLWDHCFGTLLITDDYIKYYGLFLPSVKIKFDDIKYMEIRTFKEGNVLYSESPVVGAYQFILLSTSPLPSKRIDKIHSSRKRKLIKFAISEKLCRALEGKLPGMLNRPIDYQLLLYKRAKR